MPRLRLGVVLPVPEPAAAEIDGLRRALGDGALGRIPSHLTLVPPVNVPVERLEDAEALLTTVAAGSAPIVATLGPPATFWPATPVIYLTLGSTAEPAVNAVREAVFQPPLRRNLTFSFVPHITLADEVEEDRIGPAVRALADYTRSVVFDRITLLQEGEGRRWTPRFEALLGGAWVVGRGGLPLDLSVSSLAPPSDPAVRARLGLPPGLVITAHRQASPAGLAEIRLRPPPPAYMRLPDPAGARTAWLTEFYVHPAERGTGVGSHLLAAALARAVTDLGADGMAWRSDRWTAGLASFLLHRGFEGGDDPGGGGALLRRC
ncbi:MAG TPA: 2'-5' RNA ligase family protein [Acidimicrobiales bacterium]|nr:2'-5' RNA ligase family protein [Acidimicrobiales bacterium]